MQKNAVFTERYGSSMAKKIGQFFLSFLPFLCVLALQFIASFFLVGIAVFVKMLKGNTDFFSALSSLQELFSSSDFNSYIMIIYALLAIAVFGIWYYLQFYATYLPNVKETFHPLMFAGVLLLVPGSQYLCSYLIAILSAIFPSWLTQYQELLKNAGMDSNLTASLLLYSVILAPICEELVCRGVTMSSAKRCMPFWAANLLQAFLFGLLHMNWLQGSYAFCLGLILGYVCEKSGSIYVSILFHMLFNFWGTVLEQFISSDNTILMMILWVLLGVLAPVAGFVLFELGVRKRNRNMLPAAAQIS